MNKFLVLSAIIIFIVLTQFTKTQSEISILNNANISWSSNWQNHISIMGGEEIRFSVFKTDKIVLEASTTSNSKGEGLHIEINDLDYFFESPNLVNQTLKITLDPSIQNKIRIRHYCSGLPEPCRLKLKYIGMQPGGRVDKYKIPDNNVLVFGDSISLSYGTNNYSFFLADKLDFNLANASYFGSMVSDNHKNDYSYKRIQDLAIQNKPGKVLVLLGANDVLNNIPSDDFYLNYKKLIFLIKQKLPASKIYLAGIFKVKTHENAVLEYNKLIYRVADEFGVIYINTDGWLVEDDLIDIVHPSVFSEEKIAENFYNILKR